MSKKELQQQKSIHSTGHELKIALEDFEAVVNKRAEQEQAEKIALKQTIQKIKKLIDQLS